MPKGTKVHKMYDAIKESQMAHGASKGEAERIAAATAQKKTGKSLATGKKPKRKK